MVKDWFRSRSGVAAYLRVSRMTLSRWEKIVPLPLRFGASHIIGIEVDEVNAWYQKLRKKHRPYNDYQKKRITAAM
ncbi:hypothetical protein ES703_50912 [subsurface metagenome]